MSRSSVAGLCEPVSALSFHEIFPSVCGQTQQIGQNSLVKKWAVH